MKPITGSIVALATPFHEDGSVDYPTLRKLMTDYRSPFVPDLPRFTGGAVGALSYDAVARFEPTVPMPSAAYASARTGSLIFAITLGTEKRRDASWAARMKPLPNPYPAAAWV